MKLISVANYNALSFHTARLIAAQVMLHPDSVLGLATGSSPIGAYRQLAADCKDRLLDFSNIKTVNLDEYLGLEDSHPQSYHHFMQENLFDSLNIPEESIHIPNGTPDNAQQECTRYDQLISSLGGIDFMLLGIGSNGHIGFNEPSKEFSKGTAVVELSQATRQDNMRFFDSIDQVPTRAISVGTRDIFQAKTIVLMASGQEKAQAVKQAFFGAITPEVPASILQLHPNFFLIADFQALSLVEEGDLADI